MRKIYKAINRNETAQAWIGNSAPVPDGWFLDVNSAKDAFNKGGDGDAVREEEKQGSEEVAVKRGPGRPRKVV